MPRTKIRQDSQVSQSGDYDDSLPSGVTLETASTDLQSDLNALRSQVRRLIGSANWYDAYAPPAPPFTLSIVNFSWNTASPLIIQAVTAGQCIARAGFLIEVPFDGVGSSVSFGTTGLPGGILGASDVNVQAAGQYERDELFSITVGDILILTITPTTSSQGSGLLFYELKT